MRDEHTNGPKPNDMDAHPVICFINFLEFVQTKLTAGRVAVNVKDQTVHVQTSAATILRLRQLDSQDTAYSYYSHTRQQLAQSNEQWPVRACAAEFK